MKTIVKSHLRKGRVVKAHARTVKKGGKWVSDTEQFVHPNADLGRRASYMKLHDKVNKGALGSDRARGRSGTAKDKSSRPALYGKTPSKVGGGNAAYNRASKKGKGLLGLARGSNGIGGQMDASRKRIESAKASAKHRNSLNKLSR